jgi:hypothetical protein
MSNAPPRSLSAWMEVLAQIEQTLQESLALAAEPAPTPRAEQGPLKAPLQVLDERLARWQASQAQAERNASEADALLGAAAQALEGWRQAGRAARERLANCAGGRA